MSAWTIDQEIDANYDWFRRHIADFIEGEHGRVAVLRNAQIVGFFDSASEADVRARSAFPDGIYSLQPVLHEPVDLGFFSHAGG